MKDQDLMTHSEKQVENNLEGKETKQNLQELTANEEVFKEKVLIEDQTVPVDEAVAQQQSTTEEIKSEEAQLASNTDEAVKEIASVDYASMTKTELVDSLSETVSLEYSNGMKTNVEIIRSLFYTKHKEDQILSLKAYLADGGLEEDYDVSQSDDELRVKSLLKEFREKKHVFSKKIELEKDENLKKKYAIIEKIKQLANSDEAQGNPFSIFKNLQKQWFEIGMVPQSALKHMWDSYHHNVEKFYDYVKINQELKELDFKHNLDAKTLLCENAEALIGESSIVDAFKLLQDLHDQWREVGPVTRELKEDLWQRFKAATTKINKKHQDHYEDIKSKQRENLAQKAILCGQVEEIASRDFEQHKEWNNASKEIIEIQNSWRNIGFAPRKENDQIYKRFRSACDEFFARKRDYYLQLKDVLNVNLEQKIELCIKAESLKESADWKRTTDELIAIQKQWKEIGAVPRKDSDIIWNRFRSACDCFFNNKTEHYNSLETEYVVNLEAKRKLIDRLKEFSLSENFASDIETLKQIQQEWTTIGHVPFNEKDKVIKEFRVLINSFYDNMKTEGSSMELERFKSKVDAYKLSSRPDDKIANEKSKLQLKLKQLESDIILWENNLGFFANSKSADSLIADFKKKIEKAKENVSFLKEKIRVINKLI